MVKTFRSTSHTTYDVTITASTIQTQGQQQLIADNNVILTVGNTNDVVTLPPARTGLTLTVINLGVNTLQIFPASGDDLGEGVDVATISGANKSIQFFAFNDTNWKALTEKELDVKSGMESAIADDSTRNVVFATAFSSTPHVTISQNSTDQEHVMQIESVSTTGFTINIVKIHGGVNDSVDVSWIATDAGDP